MFGVATTMPPGYAPPESETEDPSVLLSGSEAEDESESALLKAAHAGDNSPINYFFFGVIGVGVASCIFVWMGGLRFLRRFAIRMPFRGKYTKVASDA